MSNNYDLAKLFDSFVILTERLHKNVIQASIDPSLLFIGVF